MSATFDKALTRLRYRMSRGADLIRQPFAERRIRKFDPNLVLFDHHFPNPGSGFVTSEFRYYLRAFNRSLVASRGLAWHSGGFTDRLNQFEAEFPDLRGRVVKVFGAPRTAAPVAYTIFFYQAWQLWEALSQGSTKIVFTLNPGGGFSLVSGECRERLLRISSSRNFLHLFATQHCTAEYLQALGLREGSEFTFIYGSLNFEQPVNEADRLWFGESDRPLHIGFAGYKYSPGGFDKGFDVFCRIAEIANSAGRNWRFSCWGSFFASDAANPGNAARFVEFNGPTSSSNLSAQLRGVDIFVSPNRANRLAPGAFDGFPLGTSIQAGKAGAVMMITDPVGLNHRRFVHAEDLFLMDADPDPVAEDFFLQIEALARHPDVLKAVGLRGARALGRYFNESSQMGPRESILRRAIECEV